MRFFWPIWLTITFGGAICVASALGLREARRGRKEIERASKLTLAWPQVQMPEIAATLILLGVFIASYIAITLIWEDFAYYDNEYFTLGTLKGHDLGLSIFKNEGRFFPLGFQEFNLIRHFTDTVTGYHVLPTVQFLILFYILLVLDEPLSITARATLAVLTLLTPSVLTSFNGLIFPERNVLFFLGCLLLSVRRFELTRSIPWAVAAVVSAQIMIYYKETAFLLLLGFATGRLILRHRNGHYAKWVYDRLWDKESRLDLCFALLGVLFLLYYFAEMRFQTNMNYAVGAREPRAELVLGYLRIDLLAWLFVAVVLGRIFLILRHQVAPLLLWDGIAFGGVAYFFGFLYLGVFGIYYLAPVDLIAVLYVGRFAVLSWKKMRFWGRIPVLLLAFTVLLQDVLVSAYAVFERKNVIHGKVEVASVVEARFRNGAGHPLRLFFPFASPYRIMEFAAYLDYRGVPVEGAVGEAVGPDSLVLAAKATTEDGPCVEWVSIRCHAVVEPAPGDLVIVLPDDIVSLAQASVYRDRGKLLFFYEPFPHIPDWLHSLFDSLYIGATRLRHKKNPDRWMDASVTIWN
jgi:hypothetical protein